MIYHAIKIVKEAIQSEPFNITVTEGDLFDVDLDKQTLFPLAHITVKTWQDLGSTIKFDIDVIFMDLLDIDPDERINNKVDVWNNQALLASRVKTNLERGKISDKYTTELEDVQAAELFTDRFTADVAGTVFSFSLITANNMTIC